MRSGTPHASLTSIFSSMARMSLATWDVFNRDTLSSNPMVCLEESQLVERTSRSTRPRRCAPRQVNSA